MPPSTTEIGIVTSCTSSGAKLQSFAVAAPSRQLRDLLASHKQQKRALSGRVLPLHWPSSWSGYDSHYRWTVTTPHTALESYTIPALTLIYPPWPRCSHGRARRPAPGQELLSGWVQSAGQQTGFQHAWLDLASAENLTLPPITSSDGLPSYILSYL